MSDTITLKPCWFCQRDYVHLYHDNGELVEVSDGEG